MQTYTYEALIDDSRLITLSLPQELVGSTVKVIVTPVKNGGSKMTGLEFVNKWGGFLKNVEIKENRLDYIESKHK
ncbi:MAG: hypothetical protein RBT61_13330 [Candidatus Kapabacteria bacterium]|nr:hypothetical protein [Candidatus Kapabacteria bacterium]